MTGDIDRAAYESHMPPEPGQEPVSQRSRVEG